MKRLVTVLVTVIILYAVYYDLSHGTLPRVATEKAAVSTTEASPDSNSDLDSNSTTQSYFEYTIGTGDTVLSIIEDRLNSSIPVPISVLVTDFKELNNGTSPQEIQPGKKYKFPDYKKEQ